MPTQELHTKNIRLPRDLHDEIIEIARENDRSGEAEIRMALREWARRHRKRKAA
jgi:predicted transcriptional regulator